MRGILRQRQGQSIIEYLVVAAAIIAAILVFGPTVKGKVESMGTKAADQIDSAAGTLTISAEAR